MQAQFPVERPAEVKTMTSLECCDTIVQTAASLFQQQTRDLCKVGERAREAERVEQRLALMNEKLQLAVQRGAVLEARMDCLVEQNKFKEGRIAQVDNEIAALHGRIQQADALMRTAAPLYNALVAMAASVAPTSDLGREITRVRNLLGGLGPAAWRTQAGELDRKAAMLDRFHRSVCETGEVPESCEKVLREWSAADGTSPLRVTSSPFVPCTELPTVNALRAALLPLQGVESVGDAEALVKLCDDAAAASVQLQVKERYSAEASAVAHDLLRALREHDQAAATATHKDAEAIRCAARATEAAAEAAQALAEVQALQQAIAAADAEGDAETAQATQLAATAAEHAAEGSRLQLDVATLLAEHAAVTSAHECAMVAHAATVVRLEAELAATCDRVAAATDAVSRLVDEKRDAVAAKARVDAATDAVIADCTRLANASARIAQLVAEATAAYAAGGSADAVAPLVLRLQAALDEAAAERGGELPEPAVPPLFAAAHSAWCTATRDALHADEAELALLSAAEAELAAEFAVLAPYATLVATP